MAAPATYDDRYRVLGVLGAGAMGEVLRAEDVRLGRQVAIKRLKHLYGPLTASFQARFEAEARALAALAHPGVVQVYDLGVEDGEPFLVMELVDGPSLRALLKERGPLPAADVRALGIQLARALEVAHARGILHRDVKPGNILRAPDGVWKLADFGVARMPDSTMTLAGQFIGTPAYAAPEALTRGQFSPASDVFGLAATLVEACTGAKPRGDLTVQELIERAHEPVGLLGVAPELAPSLARALARDPSARPGAGPLAEMLAGADLPATSAAAVARSPAPAPDSTIAVPDGPAPTAATADLRASTVAVPDGSLAAAGAWPAAPGGTVAVPDGSLAAGDAVAATAIGRRRPDRRRRSPAVVALGALAVLVVVALIGRRCGESGTDAARPGPAGAPPGWRAALPRTGGEPARRSGIGDRDPAAADDTAEDDDGAEDDGDGDGYGGGYGGGYGDDLSGYGDDPAAFDDGPLTFAMPRGLDGRAVREWSKVADRVNRGDYHEARKKLRDFERRFGASPQSARLAAWLDRVLAAYGDEVR